MTRIYLKIEFMIQKCHFEATKWLRNLEVTRYSRFLTCVRNDKMSIKLILR